MAAEAWRVFAFVVGRRLLWVRSGPYGPAHAPFWICQRGDGRRVLWGREDAKRERCAELREEVQGG